MVRVHHAVDREAGLRRRLLDLGGHGGVGDGADLDALEADVERQLELLQVAQLLREHGDVHGLLQPARCRGHRPRSRPRTPPCRSGRSEKRPSIDRRHRAPPSLAAAYSDTASDSRLRRPGSGPGRGGGAGQCDGRVTDRRYRIRPGRHRGSRGAGWRRPASGCGCGRPQGQQGEGEYGRLQGHQGRPPRVRGPGGRRNSRFHHPEAQPRSGARRPIRPSASACSAAAGAASAVTGSFLAQHRRRGDGDRRHLPGQPGGRQEAARRRIGEVRQAGHRPVAHVQGLQGLRAALRVEGHRRRVHRDAALLPPGAPRGRHRGRQAHLPGEAGGR